jgi:hypothetical protein
MVFPAINLHLFWGFSMAMLNNQRVDLSRAPVPGRQVEKDAAGAGGRFEAMNQRILIWSSEKWIL